MKFLLKTVVFLSVSVVFFHLVSYMPFESFSLETIKQKPEFFILEWEKGTELTPKKTAITFEVDSIGQHEVVLLVDKKKRPTLFTSDIAAPVCADGECKLMHIKLYWTLLGEYAGFDRNSDLPLTKHDHDEFLQEDYIKLHELLMDNRSILERRAIDQLVEKPTMREVNGVDALSGATVKEVKESVVSGALYSCFVAWHLVHGSIQDAIKEYTKVLVDTDLLMNMLQSKNTGYQMFALNRLDKPQYEENYERIAEIFKTGIPMARGFIIKNLPDSFWASDALQKPFWDAFTDIDLNSRSFLMEHLDSANEDVISNISPHLGVMSKNQLKAYLVNLEKYQKINPNLKNNLQDFAKSDSETYSYLVHEFLEDR